MQFIYRLQLLRPALLSEGPTEEEARALGAHVTYLEDLSQAGTVLMAGRTQTSDAGTFGLVILEASSTKEASQVMEKDPGVERGVMRAELYPFGINVLSDHIKKMPTES
ncbi:MAG: hypothetical protein ACI8X5_002376 [Planctomycetota bacterium]|jgi:uncharacterized protein YciI